MFRVRTMRSTLDSNAINTDKHTCPWISVVIPTLVVSFFPPSLSLSLSLSLSFSLALSPLSLYLATPSPSLPPLHVAVVLMYI